ncbi:MAG: hypothetical protein QM785_07440 [Pyrinomonadaceae bacterium]
MSSLLAVGSFAQMAEGLKQNEKVRQKVEQLRTGTKSMVQVEMYDGKMYWGRITDANEKTFTVVDDKNVSKTADYGDVKKVSEYKKMSSTKKAVLVGALAGVGTAIVVFVVALSKGH